MKIQPVFYHQSSIKEQKMNLLTTKTSWAISLLLAAQTIFGQEIPKSRKSFEKNQEIIQSQLIPAYNAPSRINIRGSWDFFTDASFIYWQLMQENMEVAFSNNTEPSALPSASESTGTAQGNFVELETKYKPGFKIGFGVNLDQDNWDIYSEYTWLHTTNKTKTQRIESGLLFPLWGNPTITGENVFNTASEKWLCNFDFIDLELARSYYVGSNLAFRPFFGARAAWIRQSLNIEYVNLDISLDSPITATPGTQNTILRSRSWGLGPRAGLNTNWNLGQGIRAFGNGYADLLYTQYVVQTKNTFASKSFIAKEKPRGLRAHLDLQLGFGWGSYFDSSNWHIDLSAAYEFQAFFNQNMFRHFDGGANMMALSTTPNGDLFAHGLTATFRFDF